MPRFALFLIAFLFCSASAFAQDAAAPVVSTWGEVLSFWRDGAAAALATGISALLGWFGWKKNKSDKVDQDAKETREGLDWEELIGKVAEKVFSLAAIKMQITPDKLQSFEDKEGFLGWAAFYFRKYHSDLAAWLDKNGNGVPDFLEHDTVDPAVEMNGVRVELESRLFKIAPAAAFKAPKSVSGSVSVSAAPAGFAPSDGVLPLMGTSQPRFSTPRSARDIGPTFKPKNKRPV